MEWVNEKSWAVNRALRRLGRNLEIAAALQRAWQQGFDRCYERMDRCALDL